MCAVCSKSRAEQSSTMQSAKRQVQLTNKWRWATRAKICFANFASRWYNTRQTRSAKRLSIRADRHFPTCTFRSEHTVRMEKNISKRRNTVCLNYWNFCHHELQVYLDSSLPLPTKSCVARAISCSSSYAFLSSYSDMLLRCCNQNMCQNRLATILYSNKRYAL